MIGSRSNNKSGFTLLELLVSVLIFAIIMILVSSILTRVMTSSRVSSYEQEVSENMRTASDYIERELRGAQYNTSTADTMCNNIQPKSYFWVDANTVNFMDVSGLCRTITMAPDNNGVNRLYSQTFNMDTSIDYGYYITSGKLTIANLIFTINYDGASNPVGLTYLIESAPENTGAKSGYSWQSTVTMPIFDNYYGGN